MSNYHADVKCMWCISWEFADEVANCIEMMGLIGAGNNPMVGMTVAVAVSIEEAATAGKF